MWHPFRLSLRHLRHHMSKVISGSNIGIFYIKFHVPNTHVVNSIMINVFVLFLYSYFDFHFTPQQKQIIKYIDIVVNISTLKRRVVASPFMM